MPDRIYSRFLWPVFGLLVVVAGVISVSGTATCGDAVPARESRAAFCHAMAKVQYGWSKEQVSQLLGSPDDIWSRNEPSPEQIFGDEAWCYGTNGHYTLPTLGYIVFRNEKVEYMAGSQGTPPSPNVIGEDELVQTMRRIYLPRGRDYYLPSDSLHLIQVSNLLIPKGQKKALAILGEFGRIQYDGFQDNLWLYWLVRVMFTSNRPGGVFPFPMIGTIIPELPKDLRKWPMYPVMMVDDIPICFIYGWSRDAPPEPFNKYLQQHKKEWSIKLKQLRPPDDPFPVFRKLITSSTWPFPRAALRKNHSSIPYDYEGSVMDDILRLLRTAYRPRLPDNRYINRLEYDKYHKEFLALGCRWDTVKQMYVRKDGIVLPDTVDDYQQYRYHFRRIPRLNISITFSRRSSSMVDYRVSVSELGTGKIQPAIISVENPDTKKEVHWMFINNPSSGYDLDRTKQDVLASRPHKIQEGHDIASIFDLAKGKRVRFVILYGGKKYASPVYTP